MTVSHVEFDVDVVFPDSGKFVVEHDRDNGRGDVRRNVQVRSVHVRLPSISGRSEVAATIDNHYVITDVLYAGCGFYIPAYRVREVAAHQAVQEKFRAGHEAWERNMPPPRGALTPDDVATLGERFAVDDGVLYERVHEPVLVVEIEDSGRRLTKRARARMNATVNTVLRPWTKAAIDAKPLTASASPAAIFPLTGLADAEALVVAVSAAVPFVAPPGARVFNDEPLDAAAARRHDPIIYEINRRDLFVRDGLAGTVGMLAPAVVDLGMTAIKDLPRGAIEHLVALRRQVDEFSGGDTSRDLLLAICSGAERFADDLRAMAVVPRAARGEDVNRAVRLKRALVAATLLAKRAATEPDRQPAVRLGEDQEGIAVAGMAP